MIFQECNQKIQTPDLQDKHPSFFNKEISRRKCKITIENYPLTLNSIGIKYRL